MPNQIMIPEDELTTYYSSESDQNSTDSEKIQYYSDTDNNVNSPFEQLEDENLFYPNQRFFAELDNSDKSLDCYDDSADDSDPDGNFNYDSGCEYISSQLSPSKDNKLQEKYNDIMLKELHEKNGMYTINISEEYSLNMSHVINFIDEYKIADKIIGMNLVDNNITETFDLTRLTHLKKLNLSKNPLTSFNIANIPITCKKLNLSTCKLSDSTTSFSNTNHFIDMIYIDLSNNNLKDTHFDEFPNLIELNIKNNLYQTFSDKFYPSLLALNASNNILSSFTDKKFPLLEEVKLKKNKIDSVTLKNNYGYINLSNNALHKIDTSIHATICEFDDNYLYELPTFGSELRKLYASHNVISNAESIKSLTKLTDLILEDNNLSSINVSNLYNLNFLDLCNNKLTEFPKLGDVANNTMFIDISRNSIESIEDYSISDLNKIKFNDLMCDDNIVYSDNIRKIIRIKRRVKSRTHINLSDADRVTNDINYMTNDINHMTNATNHYANNNTCYPNYNNTYYYGSTNNYWNIPKLISYNVNQIPLGIPVIM